MKVPKEKKKKKEKREKKKSKKKRKIKSKMESDDSLDETEDADDDGGAKAVFNEEEEELLSFLEERVNASPIKEKTSEDTLMQRMRKKNEATLKRMKEIEEDKRLHK